MLLGFTPKSVSLKQAVVAAVSALAIAVPAAPALAWGQRERDTLTGVAGALLIENVIRNSRHTQAQAAQPQYVPQPQPQPRYVKPHYQPRYVEPQYQPRRRHYEQRVVVAPSIYATPAADAFKSYSWAERRMIQRRLAVFGYYDGGVDGSFGPGTYSAITAYANAQGQGRALRATNTAYAVYDGLIY
jgi:hypothetical protein